MQRKATRKRPYFTMESAMTAILRDASGKMHHGILFARRLAPSQGLALHIMATSLRKHPFLLALRPCGRFARRNVCDSAEEFHTDDANQCLHNKSGSMGFQIQICPILRFFWSILVKCCVRLPTSSSKTQTLLLEKSIFHKY